MQRKLIEYADTIYPEKLRELKNPPSRLYTCGNIKLLNKKGISVVGSRSNTQYGEKMCIEFTKNLTEYNLIIISGLAIGIDSIAHKTCLKYSGKTIAVLPCGLNNIYPKQNIELAKKIIKDGGLQVKQFRKKYGIVENVSDREYVSNGFHCHVAEDITPVQKQDLEERFWELSNGGKIQYVKYPIGYNTDAIKALVRRAMQKGFYEGVNLALSYCDDCGHEELNMDTCPKCGSKNLTKIDRMNGYLSYSRVKGDTRLNEAKMAEISERKSM